MTHDVCDSDHVSATDSGRKGHIACIIPYVYCSPYIAAGCEEI